MGANLERNWATYLKELERIGYRRREPRQEEKRIRLLYFSWLAQKLRKETEELVAPPSVVDVDTLLVWLGRRKLGAASLFDRERVVRVTLNKKFAEGFSRLHDGDEVGIIPPRQPPRLPRTWCEDHCGPVYERNRSVPALSAPKRCDDVRKLHTLELQSQPESVSDRELAEAYHLTAARLRNGANARGWKMPRTAPSGSTPRPRKRPRKRWWQRCVRPSCCPWMTCWR